VLAVTAVATAPTSSSIMDLLEQHHETIEWEVFWRTCDLLAARVDLIFLRHHHPALRDRGGGRAGGLYPLAQSANPPRPGGASERSPPADRRDGVDQAVERSVGNT
jgi:hypothetical protein